MKSIKSEIPPDIQEAPFIMCCGWRCATAPHRLLARVRDLSECTMLKSSVLRDDKGAKKA